MSVKYIGAVSLATLMATTFAASAAPANATDVFATSDENTVVRMTAQEMAKTQDLFACGGWCIAGPTGYTVGMGAFGDGTGYALDNW